MLQRISTVVLATLVAMAGLRADPARCSATARECDQQIRQMLSGRRFLGMTVEERRAGLVVKSVVPGSPAAMAGLKPEDRLVAANARSLVRATSRDFKQILADAREGGRVWMIVARYGAYRKVEAKLEPYTKEQIDKIVSAHLSQNHPSTAGAH